MPLAYRHYLIIADLEGSSGCWQPRAAKFLTPEWAHACLAMTLDINNAAVGLLEAGADTVTVNDFHRTGYNLLPEYLDPRISLRQGYRLGLAAGFGNPGPSQAALFIGMHGASGTEAFLPHTLTSQVAKVEINGRPLGEAELFAAALAPFQIHPLFFSGCPQACRQARRAIQGIAVFSLDKRQSRHRFDPDRWRKELAQAVLASACRQGPPPYQPEGPFHVRLHWSSGPQGAKKIARRWNLNVRGSVLVWETDDLNTLYRQLIDICYLTPAIKRILPLSLATYHLIGLFGQRWVQRQIRTAQ